jgi:hypothetical protein
MPTEGGVLLVRPASFTRAWAAMPRIAARLSTGPGGNSPQHQQNTRGTRKVGTRWWGWVLDASWTRVTVLSYSRTKSAAPACSARICTRTVAFCNARSVEAIIAIVGLRNGKVESLVLLWGRGSKRGFVKTFDFSSSSLRVFFPSKPELGHYSPPV